MAEQSAPSLAQIAFLRFASERPPPFAWLWLKADGSISLGPATHAFLAARKTVRGAEVQARITVAEFEALAPYWARPLVELSEAGVEVLKCAGARAP